MQPKQCLSESATSTSIAFMTDADRLPETVPSFRVSRKIYEVVKNLKAKERRTLTETARLLLERGVAAYLRDGLLFEPDENDNGRQSFKIEQSGKEVSPGKRKSAGK